MELSKHLIDPKKKDEKWAKDIVSHMDYATRESWFYNRRKQWIENQSYSEGNQDISRYQADIVNAKGEEGADAAAINYKQVPWLTHYKDIYLGMVGKRRFVTATAVDPDSTKEKLEMRHRLEARLRYAEMYRKMGEDIPQIQQNEVDMWMEMNVKQTQEHMIETLCDYVYFINGDEDLWREVDENVFNYGVVALRERIKPNGHIIVENLDPKKMRVPDTGKRDFSDVDYFGYEQSYTIGEISKMYPEMSTAELRYIAQNGSAPAGTRRYGTDYVQTDVAGNPRWMQNTVMVIEWVFQSIDDYYYQERTNKNGETIVTQEEYGYSKPYSKKRKVHNTRWERWYKCTQVLGCDKIIGFGPVENQLMKNDNPFRSPAPFHVRKVYEKPPAERAIPVIDQLHLDWYNLQNIKAKARPDSIAIDYDALVDAIPDGDDGTLSPREIVSLYQGGQVLFYSSRSSDDYNIQHGAPLIPIPGGVGQAFRDFTESVFTNLEWLRRLLGISEGLDASTPDARQAVTNTMLANQGTKTSLRTHKHALRQLFRQSVETIVLLAQGYVRNGGKLTVYEYAIGSNAQRALTIDSSISPKQFGFRVDEEPDPEEVEQLMAMTAAAKTTRDQNGVGGIETADYWDVIRYVKRGRLDIAIVRLKIASERAARKDLEKQQLLQQENAKAQQQSAMVAENEKRKTMMQELELYKQKLEAEKVKDLDIAREKHDLDMKKLDKEIELKRELEKQVDEFKNENKKELETHKSQLNTQ